MRRTLVATAAVATTAVLGTGAYLLGANTHTPQSSGGHHLGPPPPARSTDGAEVRSPDTVALAFVDTLYRRSWQEPPDSWIDRAQPWTTGDVAAELVRQRSNAGPAAPSPAAGASRCETSLRAPAAVIPAEAPRTEEVVYVQVSGTVVTECATATPPPDVPVAATFELRHTPRGWQVARQLGS